LENKQWAERLILEASAFATRMHADQKRKYTGEPYVLHCFEVAALVAGSGASIEMIVAALLHDVVEDTSATIADVQKLFGAQIAEGVVWLTDISTQRDGNRAIRRALDRDHIAKAPADIKTVKLADIISNTRSIVEHGGGFAKVYLLEMEALLEVLTEGDPALWHEAKTEVDRGFAKRAEAETTPS
jgi:(p)ppGpp synthase/HD superfamily hydrolase